MDVVRAHPIFAAAAVAYVLLTAGLLARLWPELRDVPPPPRGERRTVAPHVRNRWPADLFAGVGPLSARGERLRRRLAALAIAGPLVLAVLFALGV